VTGLAQSGPDCHTADCLGGIEDRFALGIEHETAVVLDERLRFPLVDAANDRCFHPGRFQRGGEAGRLFPGFRRHLRIKPGLGEEIAVEVDDRGAQREWKTDHFAIDADDIGHPGAIFRQQRVGFRLIDGSEIDDLQRGIGEAGVFPAGVGQGRADFGGDIRLHLLQQILIAGAVAGAGHRHTVALGVEGFDQLHCRAGGICEAIQEGDFDFGVALRAHPARAEPGGTGDCEGSPGQPQGRTTRELAATDQRFQFDRHEIPLCILAGRAARAATGAIHPLSPDVSAEVSCFWAKR